jgi:uncharacterized protein YgbK (DUF1537 family)
MMEATEAYLRLQQQIVSRSGEILKEDRDVMVFASNGREAVAKTLDRGRSQGLSETQVFQRVSAQLAEAASCIVEKSGVQRMVVGGGDTSAKVCRKLGLSELEILGEIEPGVPLSRSISFPRMGVVLKSGSFGDDEFFATAIGALRTLS